MTYEYKFRLNAYASVISFLGQVPLPQPCYDFTIVARHYLSQELSEGVLY